MLLFCVLIGLLAGSLARSSSLRLAKNKFNQLHWRRNCLFEPSRNQNFDWVGKCLSEIEIAFRWGKPAVISAHRENFIGSIFEENRLQSLEKLELLLTKVFQKWPNVQFINSAQLAESGYKLGF